MAATVQSRVKEIAEASSSQSADGLDHKGQHQHTWHWINTHIHTDTQLELCTQCGMYARTRRPNNVNYIHEIAERAQGSKTIQTSGSQAFWIMTS